MRQPKLTSKQDMEVLIRQTEYATLEHEAHIKDLKINARKIALQYAPNSKTIDIGDVKTPAKGIIDEAEIIYKWLIKDL